MCLGVQSVCYHWFAPRHSADHIGVLKPVTIGVELRGPTSARRVAGASATHMLIFPTSEPDLPQAQ